MTRRRSMLIAAALFAAVGLVSGGPSAAAQGGNNGGCPDGFALHHIGDAHDHHMHGDHRMVGNLGDANGDGMLCAKHVGRDGRIHVHIDNNATR